ncbi:MAG: UxaA family hydrolase [Candidatus Bipolaricaulia bacterium]
MAYQAVAHRNNDDVAVAVQDLSPGTTVHVRVLKEDGSLAVEARAEIPLGHKIALHDLDEEQHVTEYGETTGFMTEAVEQGGHVHVHNIKSRRWSQWS